MLDWDMKSVRQEDERVCIYTNDNPPLWIQSVSPGKSCGSHRLIVHLGKDVLDGGALEICPFNHFAGSSFYCAGQKILGSRAPDAAF